MQLNHKVAGEENREGLVKGYKPSAVRGIRPQDLMYSVRLQLTTLYCIIESC